MNFLLKRNTKSILLLASLFCFFSIINGQIKVGNNPTTIQSTSLIEMEHSSKGFLLPRMTTAQINAMTSAAFTNVAKGLMVYNTDLNCVQVFYRAATAGTSYWRCLSTKGGFTGSPTFADTTAANAANPAPVEGDEFYNSSCGCIMKRVGGRWVRVAARTNSPVVADTTAANLLSPAPVEGDEYYDASCGCTIKRIGGRWVRIGIEPWYNAANNDKATSNTQNVYQMGRVGIGTNSPSAPLDVVGTTRIGALNDSAFLINLGRASSIGTFRSGNFNSDGNNMSIINHQNGYFRIATNNNERIRIISSGEIGIGTISPTNTLDVNGTARVRTLPSGAASDSIVTVSSTGVLRKITRQSLANANSNNNIKQYADTATANTNMAPLSNGDQFYSTACGCTYVRRGGRWVTVAARTNSRVVADTTAANSLSPAPVEGDEYYDASCGCTIKRIGGRWVRTGLEPWFSVATGVKASSNTENIYQLANVGIGTNNPNNRLEINTAGASTSGQSGLRFSDLNYYFNPTVGGTKFLSVTRNGDVILRNMGADEVEFSVNANPNTGGTTFSPNTPQDENVVYTSTIDGSKWIWDGTSYVAYTPKPTTEWYLNGTRNDAQGNKTAQVYREGNVGIGIAVPNNGKLHLHNRSTGASTISLIHLTTGTTDTTTSDGGALSYTGSDLNFVNRETGKLRFFTSNSIRAIFDDTGAMGINTVSPGARLEINTSAASTAGKSGLRFTDLRYAYKPTNGGSKYLSVNSTGDVILRKAGQDIVYFTSGTNDPNAGGTTFNPNKQQNEDYVYIDDAKFTTWVWNGSAYVRDTVVPATPFRLWGSTLDAGGSHTAAIWRASNIGLGVAKPAARLHLHVPSGFAGVRLTNSTTDSTGSDGAYMYLAGTTLLLRNLEGTVGDVQIHTNNASKIIAYGDGNIAFGSSATTNAVTGTDLIAGGYDNQITGTYSATLGGRTTLMYNTDYAAVVGGYAHRDSGDFSFIGGGNFNRIGTDSFNTIVGGNDNRIIRSARSFIGGGESNYINTLSDNCNILGGSYNMITVGGYGTILGGTSNTGGGRCLIYGVNNSISSGSTLVSMGIGNDITVTGNGGYGMGRFINVSGNGAFAFADQGTTTLTASTNNTMNMRFSNGYNLYTNAGLTTGVSLANGGTSWTSISDRRAKSNIQPLQPGLNVVMQLKPSQYNYNGQNKLSYGFIAQDVQTVLPAVVQQTTMQNGYMGINYTEIIPVLVKAIQEQQAEITKLKNQVNTLTTGK